MLMGCVLKLPMQYLINSCRLLLHESYTSFPKIYQNISFIKIFIEIFISSKYLFHQNTFKNI